MKGKFTKQEIEHSQVIWGIGVVNIGSEFLNKGDFKTVAENFVDNFYGYKQGQVLFKPTKCASLQFRTSFEGAVSYFVGGNNNFPEDRGFAIQPWVKIRFENIGFMLNETSAVAMGNYFFSELNGEETKVEYTIGYFKDIKGNIKINLHHSSLPYPR
jgi:hypothetical protein